MFGKKYARVNFWWRLYRMQTSRCTRTNTVQWTQYMECSAPFLSPLASRRFAVRRRCVPFHCDVLATQCRGYAALRVITSSCLSLLWSRRHFDSFLKYFCCFMSCASLWRRLKAYDTSTSLLRTGGMFPNIWTVLWKLQSIFSTYFVFKCTL